MTLPLGLDVLDRQVVSADKVLSGKVDDVELAREDGALRVSAMLIGPAAWPERLPGWVRGLAPRVLGRRVLRIEWDEVAEIGAVVRLKLEAGELRRFLSPLPDGSGVARLATLLGVGVTGPEERNLGRVQEVEADGARGSEGPRIEALLVGAPGLLRRLGLRTRLSRSTRVPWDEVAEWSGTEVRLRS
jgi:sporulation protein YlmC with PRC-barrel domain